MATIALVAGGFIGLIQALLALALGLNMTSVLLVWMTGGCATSLIIWRWLRNNTEDCDAVCHLRSVQDDLRGLAEADLRRATIATTDGTSMSRIVRIYAERDARIASTRKNRGTDP